MHTAHVLLAALLLVAVVHTISAAPAIGIDLGTTYSCVAVYQAGTIQVIPNDQGNRITPSWVAFTKDGERLVGEAAKNQAAFNPHNTVYDVKRLIGRVFTDKGIRNDLEQFPFKIVDKNNKPYVEVSRKGEAMTFAPEEISAMVLEKMKKTAEDYIGEEVTDAVVTVPAYFNDAQRQATKDAGKIAGLNVLRVLNEPTAAALAYGLDNKVHAKKVLVFDLGGGTFDVSLLAIDGGTFRVLATSGDTHLGGADFDERLMEYLVGRFKLKRQKNLRESARALAKLRREAEKAKRILSTELQTVIEVEAIMDGIDFREIVTRAKFEEVNKDLFRKVIDPIKKVLKDTDTYPKEVEKIVLVGGSTRIPYIRNLVQSVFSDRSPESGVNPDEAVAYGAAIQAAVLSGTNLRHRVTLYDVTPLTLGIKTAGGTMAELIKRNSPIPISRDKVFSTSKDDQQRVSISVYEGERVLVKDNHLLGQFELKDIPPGPRGTQKFKVTFEVNADGMLTVSAYHIGHGSNSFTMKVDGDTGRLSESEVQDMLKKAEENQAQDKELRDRMDARDKLEQHAYTLKYYINDPELTEEDMADVDELKEEVLQYIEDTVDFVMGAAEDTVETYVQKKQELIEKAQPLVDHIRETVAAKEQAALQAEEDARNAQQEGEEGEGEGSDPEDDDEYHSEL